MTGVVPRRGRRQDLSKCAAAPSGFSLTRSWASARRSRGRSRGSGGGRGRVRGTGAAHAACARRSAHGLAHVDRVAADVASTSPVKGATTAARSRVSPAVKARVARRSRRPAGSASFRVGYGRVRVVAALMNRTGGANAFARGVWASGHTRRTPARSDRPNCYGTAGLAFGPLAGLALHLAPGGEPRAARCGTAVRAASHSPSVALLSTHPSTTCRPPASPSRPPCSDSPRAPPGSPPPPPRAGGKRIPPVRRPGDRGGMLGRGSSTTSFSACK